MQTNQHYRLLLPPKNGWKENGGMIPKRIHRLLNRKIGMFSL